MGTGLLPVELDANGIPKGTDHIEEIQQVRDGELCTMTLDWAGDDLMKNSTKCHAAVSGPGRRLDGGLFGNLFGEDDPKDPMREVIVLGGIFLEHFAVLMDFKRKRLGLAKPSFVSPEVTVHPTHLNMLDNEICNEEYCLHEEVDAAPYFPMSPLMSRGISVSFGEKNHHMEGVIVTSKSIFNKRHKSSKTAWSWADWIVLFVVVLALPRPTSSPKHPGAASADEEMPDKRQT